MNAKLCIDCEFYLAGDIERLDICEHPESFHNDETCPGIRTAAKLIPYTCHSMLAGICSDHQLFDPKERGGDDERETLRAEEMEERDRARAYQREEGQV
ncbi:MAG: hypothetical protein A3E01_00115 [Gammaproteobacteria bacterium RIFCSPHIGHO2_12_FULL_63_22]|nr:MAG: hypothetical protein A3E01_00115 [Gammaproteobacteria bacterium RIFCSPHIGHO2_12_FULL_63_22]